jgi:hypothetical protein
VDWKIKLTRNYWSLIERCDSKFVHGDQEFFEWVVSEQLILSDAENYHILIWTQAQKRYPGG